jgi:hypothetical protein
MCQLRVSGNSWADVAVASLSRVCDDAVSRARFDHRGWVFELKSEGFRARSTALTESLLWWQSNPPDVKKPISHLRKA